ncbi:MAG: gliding motility-associated C-terminal domain-containing protein [Bacteroidetes bacterium]|nr:gliding motility-associated C-terminal domain-containing protein [Bacteroidota bacterium]
MKGIYSVFLFLSLVLAPKIAAQTAVVSSILCSGAITNGTITSGVPVANATVTVGYLGGNAGNYLSQSVPSTGVLGLTATLNAGNLVVGNGNLVYTISGTATSSGQANFLINIGGQSCQITVCVGSCCFNANFEDNSFNGWQGEIGQCCGINTFNTGQIVGGNSMTNQFSIVTGPGNDPVACANPSTGQLLPLVYPGTNFSARVGDGTGTGAQAARLKYTFTISPQSNLIIVNYAVVLQDPGHNVTQQPRFEAQLYDQQGLPIPCTFYQVAASGGIPGFYSCGNSLRVKPWSTFGVDVSQYMGQTITLDVATGDCSLSGHYGYAYVSANCSSLNLSALYCQNGANNTANLSAPAGFSSYVWTNPNNNQQLATGQTAQVNINGVDTVLCTITSVNGCVATLETAVLPAEVIGSIVDSNVCAGNATLLFNATSFTNSAFDSAYWASSDGYTSNAFDFDHTFPGPGMYDVDLIVFNTANCVDTVSTTVEVYENPTAGFGFNDVCLGAIASFQATSSLLGNDTITNYWYANNDTLVGDSVTVYFNGPGNYLVELVALTENGCSDTISQNFTVFTNPTADFDVVEACIDQAVQFNNTSQGLSNYTTFEWIYNNQVVDTAFNYSSIFNTPGIHNISLVATDSFSAVVQCDDTVSFSFFVHAYPTFTYIADTIQCEDVAFSVVGNPAIVTNESINDFWEVNNVFADSATLYNTTVATPGVYQFTYNVTSAFGCAVDSTFDVYIMATPDAPVLSFNIPECPGDPFFLSATGEANSTILWSGPNNFNSNQFNVTFPLDETGMGLYSAFITSEYGCISAISQIDATITYIKDFNSFDFPNVISPNGDNTNDELDLKTYFETCDEFNLYVFNRWGNLVWEQSQNTPFFRGQDTNGNDLEDGIYTYKLLFDNYEKHGFIHVVR